MKFLRNFLQKQTKVLIKNSSWVFIGNSLRAVLVFVKAVLLVNLLGKEFYGIFVVLVEFVSLVREFFNLNVGTTVIKFGAQYLADGAKHKFNGLIKLSLFTLVFSSVLSLLVLAVLLGFWYDTFIPPSITQGHVYGFALAGCLAFLDGIIFGLLRLYYKFKQISALGFFTTLLEVLLMCIAVWFNPTVNTAITALIISKLLSAAIMLVATIRILKGDYQFDTDSKVEDLRSDLKEISSFTLSNSLSRSVFTVIKRGDVLLINAMLGPEMGPVTVAIYSIAKKLGNSIMVVIDPLTSSILPQFSNLLAEKKYVEVRKLLHQVTGMTFIVAILAFLGLFLLKDFILINLYGNDFSSAGAPLMILVLSSLTGAVFFWSLSLLQSLGLTPLRLRVSILAAIIAGGLAYWLIPEYKAVGAAIGSSTANIIMTITFAVISYSRIVKLSSNSIDAQS